MRLPALPALLTGASEPRGPAVPVRRRTTALVAAPPSVA